MAKTDSTDYRTELLSPETARENVSMARQSSWSLILPLENVWSLIGKTAPAEYIAKLTYLCGNHDNEIKHIDTVRAYTFGSNYFMKVDIVVSEEMSLSQAHYIGETLQDKLEKLPEELRERLSMLI